MQPIDNSDLAWLIIADFLADQNKIDQSEELRDLINNPEIEEWNYEHRVPNCVGGASSERVGGVGRIGGGIGSSGSVGHPSICVGSAAGFGDVGSRGMIASERAGICGDYSLEG